MAENLESELNSIWESLPDDVRNRLSKGMGIDWNNSTFTSVQKLMALKGVSAYLKERDNQEQPDVSSEFADRLASNMDNIFTQSAQVSDCSYQKPETEQPKNCVLLYNDENGTYAMCTIPASASQISLLGDSTPSSDALQKSGCPAYLSGTLIQRFFPQDRCNLADGKLHEIIQSGYRGIWPLSKVSE